MSDSKTTPSIYESVLGYYLNYSDDPKVQRLMAVTAALELINSDLLTAREKNTSSLSRHMSHLSEYADKIQEAIEAIEAIEAKE